MEIDQPGPATTLNPGDAPGFLNRRGFGGVLVRARGAIVGQHRWMTPEEFNEVAGIVGAMVATLSIGLTSASGSILALTSDRSWTAFLVTAVAAILAFATRLNPLWLLVAGGCFGFAGIL